MDGIRFILLGIALIIILYNFFVNLGNLIKIISYCYQTNTLGEYWSLYYKSSVSGRAIFSTIFGFVLALLLFIVISPLILIRSYIFGKKISILVEEGLYFEYINQDLLSQELIFYNNIKKELGFEIEDIKASGNVRIDAAISVTNIEKKCIEQNKSFNLLIRQIILLNDNHEAIVPVLIEIDTLKYPTYFIYNETHKDQFLKIKNKLYDKGYKSCLYFSSIPM